jgi:peroxiredoxin
MKNALTAILIFLYPLPGLANGFIIKGNIEGLQTGTVSLVYRNERSADTTLTANIASGQFSFAGTVTEPEIARFSVTAGWAYGLSFFLENSPINIHLIKDASEKTEIAGSVSNKVYEKLNQQMMDFFANARQNEAIHKQPGIERNHSLLKSADSIWTQQQHTWMQSISAAISENTKNYAALYFIQWLLFRPGNFDTIHALFMQLHIDVRNSSAAKKFITDFEHLRKTSLGESAPEITGKDTSGKPVTLASLKGKIVLLDFWASYCGPCRNENRQMLSLYNKYKCAGFEILSFSLDNERSLWLKAIQTDKLNWTQASELRGGASASAGIYDVTDMPRNFLIDRNGKIIAKDLFGQNLADALSDLLGKGN